jgi:hypothetical protein
LATIIFALLAQPRLADSLARKGWGAHLLDLASIATIERQDFPASAS